MKSFLLHLSIIIYYFIAWSSLTNLKFVEGIDKRLLRIRDLRSRFLTNWNFVLQTVMFLLYFVQDIIRLFGNTVREKNKLKTFLDFFFYSISAPLSIFVAATFWGLFLYNRDIIFPAVIDKIMPTWINHALHTVIVINIVLHMHINKEPSPKLRNSIYALTLIKFCYGICLYVTYFEKGLWVYPFLDKLQEPFRILSLLTLYLFALFWVVVVHYTNNLLYGSTSKAISQRVIDKKKRRD